MCLRKNVTGEWRGRKVGPAPGEVESRTTNVATEGRVAAARKYEPYCCPRNVRWGSMEPGGGQEGAGRGPGG